jgi:hypothetical protein
MTERKLYNVKEARALIGGLSQVGIYKLINSGQLRSVKIAGRRMVPAESIDDLIRAALDAAQTQQAA